LPDLKQVAYGFPGQGAQSVGMGRDLYDAFDTVKELFKQADDAINFPLTKLCFEGSDEELRKTINAQPALVLVSFACLKAVQDVVGNTFPVAKFMAGHSLGEYTALAAANVIDFKDAIYLSRERGRLMYAASLKQPGSMAAVLGLDETTLLEICKITETVIANYNCPGQLVISGAFERIAKASEMARAKGARVTPLQVSGAFHSPLMQPAVIGMSEVLNKVVFRDPDVPIIGNVTAQPLTNGAQFYDELLSQLVSSVQWQKSVEYMISQGVTSFIEIGPGKVLTGLIRRINREAELVNIGDATSIKNLSPS
jgi:[acyl-carrier-protein] S-malonyltransferase